MLTNWLNHIEFAYPWVLILLLLLPVLVFFYFKKKNQKAATLKVGYIGANHYKSGKIRFSNFPFWLRIFALFLLIVALARPRQKYVETETTGDGIDIVLCFDISGSMTERDFNPNRLEASKAVATQFVEGRPGDRIGITIFSNLSFTLTPVTADHALVLQQIANIQAGMLGEEGTAIGSGLATSVDRLRQSKAKSKIIILLTDGVDFGGAISPDVAVNMAKTYGIKVYTIGVGSMQEVDDPNAGANGGNGKRKLEFNEGLLEQMAAATGGKYFRATDNNALAGVYQNINQLEKSKIEIKTYNRYVELYRPWLFLAVLLLLLELLLRSTVFFRFP
ncbi:MAG: aerotolerance regulator BatA [Pseudopedobacter saltans]|uniref:Aerotolerance regulator BatA n=1 Tax=Pseudopedobacter saltans TaxID=151895 RepID=A0A2W5HER8_9SPHI|nr:MAG: aerotolerance regulator BatA [Pseudopedobacter saltans]